MKKVILTVVNCYIIAAALAQTNTFPPTGAVGIGTTTPNSSSLLDVTSTKKGILIPRMTLSQRNAITTPATGLLIYQTNNTPGFYYYSGSAWTAIIKKSWSLTGNSGTIPSTNFIGTTDAQPLIFKVNNVKSGQIDYYDPSGNTSFGYSSLGINTTGATNTAFGFSALSTNQTADQNTAVGYYALHYNVAGQYNCAFGPDALGSNDSGNVNSGFGNAALYLSFGNYNSGFGASSLINVDGNYNVGVGCYSGDAQLNSGSNNTFIGYSSDINSPYNFSNSTAIGSSSRITASNQVRIGTTTTTSIGGYANWTNVSDGRYKKNVAENVIGLDFIKKLRPVTYNLDIQSLNKKTEVTEEEVDKIFIEEKEKIFYTGFIAQEVEKAAKEVGFNFSGVDAPKNDNDLYGLRYAEFTVPLVKAVQELAKENENLKSEIESLRNSINLIAQQKNNSTDKEVSKVYLGQNIPNPFKKTTTISFKLPDKFTTASIRITNAETGQVIKEYPLSESQTSLNINLNLPNGVYLYSLFVDEIEIKSKQMINLK